MTVELLADAVDRSAGYGTSQSSRPWTFRAPLLDPHRTCEAVAKDRLLRLCLHARVRRLACMDGLCEQWRCLGRWRTHVVQCVCAAGLTQVLIQIMNLSLMVSWQSYALVFLVLVAVTTRKNKNSFRTRSDMELS